MNVLNRGINSVQIPESVTSISSEFKTNRYTNEFYSVVAVMILGYLFALQAMNNITNQAREIVDAEVIYNKEECI